MHYGRMPLTLSTAAHTRTIDSSRLADQMLALLGREAPAAAKDLTAGHVAKATTGIPMCDEAIIRNIFSLFSGYFINFDYGPKAIKNAFNALRYTPARVALNTAFQIVAQQPCFIDIDKDLFCQMVKQNARFRDGND